MSFDEREYVGRTSPSLHRRQFLTATSAAVALGLAGCEGATIDVGGAGPVDLASAGREELFLAERARQTESMTVESDSNESDTGETNTNESNANESTTDESARDVLTSHYVGYHRGGARDSSSFVQALLGERAGSGPGEPATVLRVSDAGFESVSVSVGRATGEVDARRVNFLVPASGRREGEIVPAAALALVPLATLQDYGGEWIRSDSSGGNVRPGDLLEPGPEHLRLVPVEDFFPSDDWTSPTDPITDSAVSRWVPGTDVDASGTVLIATGERTVEDVFGTPAAELPGRQLEEGETVDARETILAGPADQFVPGGPIWNWDELLAAGRPAPLGGATFGLGLFVTPRDERADLWPRPDTDLEAAIQSERGRELVRSFVLDPGERWPVSWNSGPGDVGAVRRASHGLAGEENDVSVASLVGAVEMDEEPAVVGVHAGRIEYEDVDVTVVGGQWTPIGEYPASIQTPGDPSIDPDAQPSPVWQEWGAQGPWEGEGASGGGEEQFQAGWSDWSRNPWIDWMDAGGSLTARAVGRLEPTG